MLSAADFPRSGTTGFPALPGFGRWPRAPQAPRSGRPGRAPPTRQSDECRRGLTGLHRAVSHVLDFGQDVAAGRCRTFVGGAPALVRSLTWPAPKTWRAQADGVSPTS